MDRATLRTTLVKLGITKVTAEYDGSGDEGLVDSPEFAPETKSKMSGDLFEAVLNLFYDLLEDNQPGWEDNEGSFGQFVWDLGADRVHLTHNRRQEVYERTEGDL